MTKPFDRLYADLEGRLKDLEQSCQGAARYLRGIAVIRDTLSKLRSPAVKLIHDGKQEIAFFRHVWPAFYSRDFLYIKLYQAELRKLTVPAESWAVDLGKEETQVRAYLLCPPGILVLLSGRGVGNRCAVYQGL